MGKQNSVAIGRAALKALMRDVRGTKVLLDRDAADYFEVEVKVLNAAVKRYRNRFPSDFMIEFNEGEGSDRELLGAARGFTEVGVDMLAGLLKSQRAIAHSIANIREGVAAFALFRTLRSE